MMSIWDLLTVLAAVVLIAVIIHRLCAPTIKRRK